MENIVRKILFTNQRFTYILEDKKEAGMMETFAGRIKKLFTDQEVRITAALQMILCFFAVTSVVRKEIRSSQKKRKKTFRQKNREKHRKEKGI